MVTTGKTEDRSFGPLRTLSDSYNTLHHHTCMAMNYLEQKTFAPQSGTDQHLFSFDWWTLWMGECGQLMCSTSPSSYNPEYLATTSWSEPFRYYILEGSVSHINCIVCSFLQAILDVAGEYRSTIHGILWCPVIEPLEYWLRAPICWLQAVIGCYNSIMEAVEADASLTKWAPKIDVSTLAASNLN